MQPRDCQHCGTSFIPTVHHKVNCTEKCRQSNWVKRNGKSYFADHNRLTHYKLSREDFDKLLESQAGLCAICQEPLGGKFTIDHDHKCCPGSKTCGKCVRGVVHNACNSAIGLLKDSPLLLRRAAEYIERTTR